MVVSKLDALATTVDAKPDLLPDIFIRKRIQFACETDVRVGSEFNKAADLGALRRRTCGAEAGTHTRTPAPARAALPITPGGDGVVEGTLSVLLIAYHMPAATAVAAVIV